MPDATSSFDTTVSGLLGQGSDNSNGQFGSNFLGSLGFSFGKDPLPQPSPASMPASSSGGTTSAPAPQTPAGAVQDGIAAGSASYFNKLGQSLGTAAGMVQAASGQASAAVAAGAQAAQAQSKAIIDAATIQAKIDSGDALAAAKRDANVAQQFVTAGWAGQPLTDKLAKAAQLDNQTNQLNDQIRAISGINFFQHPGDAIHAAFTLPLLRAKLEASEHSSADLGAEASNAASMLNVGASGAAALNSVNTTQRAAEIAAKTIAVGVGQAQEPLQKQAQMALSAAGVQTSVGGEVGRIAAEQASLPREESMTNFYDIQAKLGILTKQGMIAKFAEQTQELAEKNADKAAQLVTVNQGRADFGQPPIPSLGAIPMPQVQAYFKAGALRSGGYDPIDARNNVQAMGIDPAQLPAGQAITLKDITQSENELRAAATSDIINSDGTVAPGLKNRKDVEEFVHDNIDQMYLNRIKTPFHDDDSHPDLLYKPAPLNALLTRPWAKSNPILQAMAPLTVDGSGRPISMVPTRFQDISGTAANLIKIGKLSPDQAANFTLDIVRNSLADNDMAYGFRRFMLPVPTDSYKVYQPAATGTAALFGGNISVDYLNKGEILSYQKRMLQQKQAEDIVNELGKNQLGL